MKKLIVFLCIIFILISTGCSINNVSEEHYSGNKELFIYDDLRVEVSNVIETKKKTASDGFETWEYDVFVVSPASVATIIEADMFNDSEGVEHSRWAFGMQDDTRVYISNTTKDIKITEDIIGIYNTESSVCVIGFEVKNE